MKLIGTLIAAAFAQDGYNPAPVTDAPAPVTAEPPKPNWPGQDVTLGSTCGSQAKIAANPVNATCTLSFGGYKTAFVSVAGSFPLPNVGPMTFTGFEGISNAETQDVLVFWAQELDADGNPDNSTCGTDADIQINCEDYGGAWMTPNLVSNFAHDPRQTSFSVGVMNHDDSFTMDMGAGWSNATSDHASCTTSGNTLACPLGPDSSAGNLAYCRFSGSARSNY
jgi:hypothetical protein